MLMPQDRAAVQHALYMRNDVLQVLRTICREELKKSVDTFYQKVTGKKNW